MFARTNQALIAALLLCWLTPGCGGGEKNMMKPAETVENATGTELATLGGGCFWCVEAVYQQLEGVKAVVSGYAGGSAENPTYKEVCRGETGHAEVVQVEFDPEEIGYEEILEVFWMAHDPTTLNRQGADSGTQYRSIILYHSEEQQEAAERTRSAAGSGFSAPIVTEIMPFKKFYPAESHHQDYYANNSRAPYCQAVIRPKLEKLTSKLRSR